MATPKIIRQVETLRKKTTIINQRINERTHGWFGVLLSAINDTLKPDTAISAAAIAYFTLFSLFPLILLSISIASYNLTPMMGWQFIIKLFEFIAPALEQLLGKNIVSIIQTRGPVTGVALVSLIWSGSTVFYTLTQTLNDIWGHKYIRPVWKRRGLAILFVLAIAGPLLFLVSLLSSMADAFQGWIPDQIIFLGLGIRLSIAILLDIILLMVLYLLLPHGSSTWREILPGAIGAGLLWELAKKGFLLFVTSYVTASNLVYGSVAAIIAFLTWAYLSGLIFLFGAFLSCAYHDLNQQKLEAAEVDLTHLA